MLKLLFDWWYFGILPSKPVIDKWNLHEQLYSNMDFWDESILPLRALNFW